MGRWVAAIGCALLVVACDRPTDPPLEGIAPDTVRSILVQGLKGRIVEITDPEQIRFFVDGLRGLQPFKEGKVVPELELTVRFNDAPPLPLRMGKDHIGPAVPASDVTWRWRFADDSLYRFFVALLHRDQP